MSDKVFLGQHVSKLDIGEKPARITRVNLFVDSEHMYTAGNDTGRTIEKTCPWGSQAMCNRILALVSGIEYQPFSGESALIDPAAETGDGITVGGVYSVLADSTIRFNGLYFADIAAPGGNEIEDEYPYKSRARRQADRQLAQTYSRITKTAEQIRLEVANEVQGLSSSLTVELNGIKGQVTGLDGQVSTLEQTANSITSEISYMGQDISRIEQKVDSIYIGVSNGETSSWISLYVNGIEMSSEKIKFTGDVVFESDLRDGYTTISGDCIRTGEISAEYIRLGGEMIVYEELDSDYIGGSLGYVSSYDFQGNRTYGMGMLNYNRDYQVVVTDSGARLTSPTAEVVAAVNITLDTTRKINASTEITVTSDQRKKDNIRYDVADKYLPLLDHLKPCSFLRKDGGTQRHLGFIAQEYRDAETEAGISLEDSVILSETNGFYGLTYGEFIPLLVAKVQELNNRVKDLEVWKS